MEETKRTLKPLKDLNLMDRFLFAEATEDPFIMKSILEAVDPDVTLVVSSHLVDELERVADAALFMKEGHLVEQCMVEELRISQHKSVVDLYREIYGHGGEAVC